MGNPLDNVPEGEPAVLVAGDTWIWQRSDLASDFPVAAYSLNYSMQREGDVGPPTTFVADETGGIYKITVAASITQTKAAGVWRWVSYAVRTVDSARVAVGSGIFIVNADPAQSGDVRSHASKVLAALESLIEGRATADVSSYSIAGRSLTKLSLDELMRWRAYYRREVKRERDVLNVKSGRATGRTQVVSFG